MLSFYGYVCYNNMSGSIYVCRFVWNFSMRLSVLRFMEVIIMPVSLQKGQKVDLTKGNPGLKKIMVGLGWDVNKYDGGSEFDLDASAFLLDGSGKATGDSDFVFYGNQTHPSGSVKSLGDNKTGAGDGDDEQILIDLAAVPANLEKIDFTVTIYEADKRNQNFGQVSNAYIRIVDENSGTYGSCFPTDWSAGVLGSPSFIDGVHEKVPLRPNCHSWAKTILKSPFSSTP